ncbi:MAG: FAD-dependent oxidoreductase, partial [Streptosporangiaceae bacterium]
MNDHAIPTVERHCDVCVVGGSAAGLAAALHLARQRRSVIVVDDGAGLDRASRDDDAGRPHGFLGDAGLTASRLIAAGRAQARGYGCEVITSQVERVTRGGDGGFVVQVAGGHSIVARRVLAATGGTDVLPNIDGLAGHWGSAAFGSPAWEGYEFRDRRIVQIITRPPEVADAALLRHLSTRLTVVIDGAAGVGDTDVADLHAAGVPILRGQATRVIAGPDGHITAVEVAGHGPVEADVVVVGARFSARAEPFAPLGLRPAPHPSGAGDVLEADASGATAVPGL